MTAILLLASSQSPVTTEFVLSTGVIPDPSWICVPEKSADNCPPCLLRSRCTDGCCTLKRPTSCPASHMVFDRDLIIYVHYFFMIWRLVEARTLHSQQGMRWVHFISWLEFEGQSVLSAALRLQIWTCFNQPRSVPNQAVCYIGQAPLSRRYAEIWPLANVLIQVNFDWIKIHLSRVAAGLWLNSHESSWAGMSCSPTAHSWIRHVSKGKMWRGRMSRRWKVSSMWRMGASPRATYENLSSLPKSKPTCLTV